MVSKVQINIILSILSILGLFVLGDYYIYCQIDAGALTEPIKLLARVSHRIGPVVRLNFIIFFFLTVLFVVETGMDGKARNRSNMMKLFVTLAFIACGACFVFVDRLPYIVYSYPTVFVLFLILSYLFKSAFNIKGKLKDDFHIQTDKVRIENEYSFSLATEEGNYINVVNPFAGILVLGAAGSGKSYSTINPILVQAIKKRFALVVYDFKYPTLSQKVLYEASKQRGEKPLKVWFLNFSDLSRTHRANIFHPDNIKDVTYAHEYSDALILNLLPEAIQKKDFWIRSAGALLTATIWFLRKHHPKQCTFPHVVDIISNGDAATLIEMLSTDLETSGMIRSLKEALERKAEAQLAGVLATLQTTLVKINNPKIFWVLSGENFTLDINDKNDPKILCVGTSPDIAPSLAPVVSSIISVALNRMNTPGKHHSLVALDEAPQLFIPGFSNVPATARSNKVAVMFIAQSMQQIVKQYGQHEADSLVGNLSTQFFGRARDMKTAEYVSKVFGREDKVNHSYSNTVNGSESRSFSQSESLQAKELIKPQDVYKLETGHFLGIAIETKHPSFKGKILPEGADEEKDFVIPIIEPIDERLIKQNYIRIRTEVLNILDDFRMSLLDQ